MPVVQHCSERNDVTEGLYLTASVAVSDTQVEVKAGGSHLATRQTIILHNKGPQVVYYGPTGVTTDTGVPLAKGQTVKLMFGNISVFLISNATGANVIVQEVS